MPGPAHLLELKDQIPLTLDQVSKAQTLFDDMRKAAIPAGERLIAAETALESAPHGLQLTIERSVLVSSSSSGV